MAHRRGGFRGRGISDSQRRKKLWSPIFGPASELDLANVGDDSPTLNYDVGPGPVLTSPQAQAQAYVGTTQDFAGIDPESTLLRIRGSLILPKNIFGGIAGIETFAFGIGVMETGAAQLAAFPNPATVAGAAWDGWMFYRSINSSVVDAASTTVDVKAMRKI